MAISRGFSAEDLNGVRLPGSADALADISVETRSGIVRDLEFSFKIDQKCFGFVLRSDSIEQRNSSRLFRSMRLTVLRKFSNFSLRRLEGGAFIKASNWKIMTLWSVKTPLSFGRRQCVGYIDTVRHASDYKVKYVVATSGFFIELCQEVVVKGFNKGWFINTRCAL